MFLDNLPPRIIVWYDRKIQLWTAVFKDKFHDQVGNAGYGMTKQEAIVDLKYQQEISNAN